MKKQPIKKIIAADWILPVLDEFEEDDKGD
jgi:hypothetical protein